jgi:hypothetical protein
MSASPRSTRRVTAFAVVILLAGLMAACTPPKVPPMSAQQRTNVFSGLGAWADVYDWSPTVAGTPTFGVSTVDSLADKGVNVLYIQTAKSNRPEAILDQDLFKQIVARAHARGMRVVSWYLPGLADMRTDYLRLVLPVWLGVDGIAWDIEDTTSVPDLATRNKRLVDLTMVMRKLYKDTPMAAIVLPPVVTDIINTHYWPQFPWHQIADNFDAWMPMDYWTNRTPGTEWRDAQHYTDANITMVRSDLGRPSAPVSVIGGVADKVTPTDLTGFAAAAKADGVIGASLYDAMTSQPSFYDQLAQFKN